MYCPKCHKFVATEEHIYGDRTEYHCPYCGQKIVVVHKEMIVRPEWW